VRLEDGTIEFDVAVSARRTFVGVHFRAASPEVWEDIYIRPHKSGLNDAIQYAPAFAGGRSAWQLFHGPGETAAARFPVDTWLHVKLVVQARRAALFVGRADAAAMVVPRLALAPATGFIGFWASEPGQAPGATVAGAIANVVVRPGVVDFAFPPPPPLETPPGLVTVWGVSTALTPPGDGPVLDLPSAKAAGPWRRAEAEPSGLVPFDRFVALPANASRVSALAKLVIAADRARSVPFRFGFSDDVTVFLNGRRLYSGVDGYSFNFPRRDGLITLDEHTLYLPLDAGDNELVLAVSDVFGGWGLMGQLPERAGLTVRPPADAR